MAVDGEIILIRFVSRPNLIGSSSVCVLSSSLLEAPPSMTSRSGWWHVDQICPSDSSKGRLNFE